MTHTRRGQSTLEYTILIVIVIGAFIAMSMYVKRGFHGRWKSTVDDMGEQYDPTAVNSLVTYSLQSSSNSMVVAVPGTSPTGMPGYYTNRIDTTNSVETKEGSTTVGNP